VKRPCYSAKQKRFGLSSLEAESASTSLNGAVPRLSASLTTRRTSVATKRTLRCSVLAQATELSLERTSVSRSPFSYVS